MTLVRIDINDEALREVMRLSGARTKADAVDLALREFAALHRRITALERNDSLLARRAGNVVAGSGGAQAVAEGRAASVRSSPSTFCSSSTATGSQPPTSTHSLPASPWLSLAPLREAWRTPRRTSDAWPGAWLQSVPWRPRILPAPARTGPWR